MAEGGSFFSSGVGEPSRRAFLDVDKRVKAAQDDAASALAQIAALSPDHGSLLGLGDDDHPQYAFRNSSPTITLAGDASGSVTLTNLGSGTLTVAVNDDSHNHSTYLPLSGGTLTGILYQADGNNSYTKYGPKDRKSVV